MNDSKCAAEPGCPNPGVVVELDCGPIGFEDVPICELHLAQYQREGRVFSRLPSTPPACPSCAALRARLENAEAALRECDSVLARAQTGEGFPKDSEAWPESIHFWKAVDKARNAAAAALGAAGEKESTDG